MPISYLQLARLEPVSNVLIVPENEALIFDTVISSEGTQISYDISTGVITFNEAGYYYVDWYVAPQFGLTTDGSNWAIQTSLSQIKIVGSSHTRVSVTTGFAILNVEANETVQLVNVSDGALSLSQAVQSKAGLIAYSVSTQSSPT